MFHVVVLAGGGGTRLWPLSKQEFPKQFLRFGNKYSLLQRTALRYAEAPSVTVVTNAQYEPLVRTQLEALHQKVRILIEPERKNTAPAIAYALTQLDISEDAPLLVVPSDHLIEPQALLTHYLDQVQPVVQSGELVLFGIRPTKPETGYGYIQIGKTCHSLTHIVKRFVEKPDRKLAESYVASGDYYWNSGMFALTPRLLWQKLSQHSPDIYHLIHTDRYHEMPDISFDYAILEKMERILVCPLPVTWSDVGSWDSVYDVLEKDENQNAVQGNVFGVDTKNCLIFGGKKLIATVGVEDLLIVETDDAIFISKKGESQKVKQIVQELICQIKS